MLSAQRDAVTAAPPSDAANAEGSPLTREEAASLRAALQRWPCGAEQLPAEASDALRAGLSKQFDDLPLLEGAMLLAEQRHLEAKRRGGEGAAGPRGVSVWQPVFASAGGFPRLLYIPVPEYFDLRAASDAAAAASDAAAAAALDAAADAASARGGPPGKLPGAVDVVTELGPVTTHFLGACGWRGGEVFEYRIDSCRVEVPAWGWGFTVPFKLNNALTFVHFDGSAGLGVARSRLGGTMLLAADPPAAAAALQGRRA
ncbi:hypothetical protein Rsub_00998 [Raphidocelis subcapitata]|uniref:Uncharacterized protein n=1 Tax=Raphidocelis subcapitata TaxID=307507 RepID=A0A2V0NLJ5_9CHLO|nr:hypothetical protein Rsub_00998 [Raphidocelis subcapitata]|eukprot:GBF88286.1 hypothetical protein Rsub_00998 [Raphidocelis subcapitata]